MNRCRCAIVVLLFAGTWCAPAALAGQAPLVRDAGDTIIRATRIEAPIRIDGQLDEPLYSRVQPISDFIQTDPQLGAPATERTELWVAFDDDNFYVTFRAWESRPEMMIATEMRRDSLNLLQNEQVEFLIDTFHDRRNGVFFGVNPLGGRLDGQVTNERQINFDYSPVWDVAVGRFDNGWIAEMAVPFKSLRYQPGREQVWSFNAKRLNRWKNELSFVTPLSNALGARAIIQISRAATLVGVEAPPASRNLDIKPYVTSSLTSDLTTAPRVSNDVSGDFGVDVKYALTPNLTADVTYNTDFAQVEADEQQINLTRFSLFFPEKREFFLENQGLFGFGGVVGRNDAGDTPLLFYSRQIGLEQGRAVPIDFGGRLTGRVGRYSVGALNIQANDDRPGAPSTNFSVLRLKRDILRRSSVGLIFTGRKSLTDGTELDATYGADGTLAFFTNLAINAYWATTRSSGIRTGDTSYRTHFDYSGDRYGLQLEHLLVGDNFNPAVGFVRRDDMRRTYGLVRFSPRPRAHPVIRRFSWTGSVAYIENTAGRLETREQKGDFAIEFHNSDQLSVGYDDLYELVDRTFVVAGGLTVRPGAYDFRNLRTSYTMGQQRRWSGTVSFERGTFYGGDRTAIAFSRGRVNLTPQFSIEPTYSLNRIERVDAELTTHLIGTRVTYTISPTMFVSALPQYNSSARNTTANVRLRWEYLPGSEIFVVYNEQRDTLGRQFPDLSNRAFIVKVNRLLRF